MPAKSTPQPDPRQVRLEGAIERALARCPVRVVLYTSESTSIAAKLHRAR